MKHKYSSDGTYRNERVYRIYHNMKSRCYLPTFSRYEYYGGRGIKICKEWLGKKGFDNFYNWAMANGYADNLSIDRIDNNGDYSPTNCRWVTQLEQNNNSRKNHYITYNGETKSVSEWARIYNIHRCVLNNRLRRGWSFEKSINTKTGRYLRRSLVEKI